MADAGESLQIGRVKSKKIGIFSGFDDEGVWQRDHGIIFVSDRRLSELHGTFLSVPLLRRGNLHESGVDGQSWRNSEPSLSLLLSGILSCSSNRTSSLNFTGRDDGKTAEASASRGQRARLQIFFPIRLSCRRDDRRYRATI